MFPIKVNQQRLVVEEVYRYGSASSASASKWARKPELLAVMAMTEDAPERLIICNGFKDDSYIEAVILATKLGRTIIPVVENFSELQLILQARREVQRAAAHRRARQARERRRRAAGASRPARSPSSACSSPRSSSSSDIAASEHGMLDCLQLVHCHPGSQLQDIRRVKDAINELAHVYAELKLMGAGLQVHRRRRRARRRLRRQRAPTSRRR